MRFYQRTNKPVPANGDIFVLSSGSGDNWSDYKITWEQIVDIIGGDVAQEFIPIEGTGVSAIADGSNADVAYVELTNLYEDNEFDFDLCLNFDVALTSGSSYARVTVKLNTIGGDYVTLVQDYFADGKYAINIRKRITLEDIGNYMLSVNVAVSGGSLG